MQINRRAMLAGGISLATLAAVGPASAQGKTKLRFSCAFSEQDPRADAYKAFAAAIKDNFDFEPYYSNTLFKQGTDLVALQRGNLEVSNLAPQDLAKQLPAWSLLTSAYLFRDAAHLAKTFKSDVGKQFIAMTKEKLGIQIVTPVYFGTRQINLKSDKEIKTPADMAGIKLRMPSGEFWQFLGEALGASPTPVAFAEVYTSLQTGAIDGQDNPLVTSKVMKFDEVTNQFVLTSHLVAYDVMAVAGKVWDAMKPAQQTEFQDAADKAIGDYVVKYQALEQETLDYFKKEGKKVYTPDVAAFRTAAQKKYKDKYGSDWPEGALEKINAIS